MPFVVQKATTEDVDRLTEVIYAAFSKDPWGRIMFPTRPPLDAETPTKKRYRKQIQSDPHVTIMKVVDTENGEMAGFARWEMYFEERPESEWKTDVNKTRDWDEGTNAEAANTLIAAVVRVEEKVLAGRPHCCTCLKYHVPLKDLTKEPCRPGFAGHPSGLPETRSGCLVTAVGH